MKILKQLFFSSALLLALTYGARAQVNITELLKGSLVDANTLAEAYLEPFGKGFGASLNSGWYNTAKPHKLGGFDITFSLSTSIPPSSSKTFDVSELNLQHWRPETLSNSVSPTVSGAKESGVMMTDKATGLAQMQLPKGAGLKFIPAPMIQAGVGLPFHTEVIFRILPKINIPDVGKFSLWGFGIKNEFKEFIPALEKVPINISGFFGYTKFKSSFVIDDAAQTGNTEQSLDFNASGYTVKVLVSKSIPVLTVYAGAGYNRTTTDVALKGNYSVPGYSLVDVTDPINLDFINKGMSANVGLRIKLAVIAFHFDYTFGEYKIYNAGFGINFR